LNWYKIYNPAIKEWCQQHKAAGVYGSLDLFTKDESAAGFWSESENAYMPLPASYELVAFTPDKDDLFYREWR